MKTKADFQFLKEQEEKIKNNFIIQRVNSLLNETTEKAYSLIRDEEEFYEKIIFIEFYENDFAATFIFINDKKRTLCSLPIGNEQKAKFYILELLEKLGFDAQCKNEIISFTL